MKMLLMKAINWLLHTKMYEDFARKQMAFFTFRRYGWAKFRTSNYFKIKNLVDPVAQGIYAFVSADKCILNYRLNKLFTGARWGHAGHVYKDADGEVRIRHMLGDGLHDDSILDLFKEIDDFALLFFPLPKDSLKIANDRIKEIKSVKYDFSMDNQAELYCSEYVFKILEDLVSTHFYMIGGHWFVTPDNVYQMAHKVFEERN